METRTPTVLRRGEQTFYQVITPDYRPVIVTVNLYERREVPLAPRNEPHKGEARYWGLQLWNELKAIARDAGKAILSVVGIG